MNDLEFRREVLDTKSTSFCAAKWYNATIWLGSGQTTSCHHPPAHAIDREAIATTPSAIHNIPVKDVLALTAAKHPVQRVALGVPNRVTVVGVSQPARLARAHPAFASHACRLPH